MKPKNGLNGLNKCVEHLILEFAIVSGSIVLQGFLVDVRRLHASDSFQDVADHVPRVKSCCEVLLALILDPHSET